MIYLYGITRPLTLPPDGAGLEGVALQTERVGALTAVYSSHDGLEVRADEESCWAHERAVETVMRTQAVLPARFGTTFADLGDLRAAVARDAEALEQRLDEIDGCVELAVRINPLGHAEARPATGRQYLLDKLSSQRQREALAESTLACLQELAVASRLAASASAEESVSISYLVKAGGVERFSRAVGRLQRRWPEFGLSCTGPWAPYSFVGNSTGGRA